MRRLKLIYWLLSGLILAATLIISSLRDSGIISNPDILLSGIATSISIIAMGLSDPKLLIPKIWIGAWFVYTKNSFGMEGESYRLSLKIQNCSEDVMEDVLIRIHYPAYGNFFDFRDSSNPHAKTYAHRDTKILLDDTYRVLDVSRVDTAYIQYDFDLIPAKWTKNNVYITFSSKGFKSITFKLTPANIEELKAATGDKPFLLKAR